MSAEQAERLPVGPASDVFALSSVIAFAPAGAAPSSRTHNGPFIPSWTQPDYRHVA